MAGGGLDEAQDPADGVEDAGGGGDFGEELGDLGLGEEEFELRGTAGAFPAEDALEPGVAAGEEAIGAGAGNGGLPAATHPCHSEMV